MEANSTKELYAAFIKAQAKFKNPKKDVDSADGDYKTAPLSRYFNCVRRPLAENDLGWSQKVYNTDDQIGVMTVIFHASGQTLEGEPIYVKITEERPRELALYIAKQDSFCAIMGIVGDKDIVGLKAKKANNQRFASVADRKQAKDSAVQALKLVDTPELLEDYKKQFNPTLDLLREEDPDYIADIERDLRILERSFATNKDDLKGKL